ncbi:MAG: hypothetical protein WBF82_22455, partial [Mycobacterium sp.]
MARQRSTKRNHRSRNAKARRRAVGLSTSAGAFLAFGLGPLATAPAAHADGFELIIEPIINSLASVGPTLGADLGALMGSFDPTLAGDNAATAASLLDPAALPAADPAASPDLAQLFNEFIYTPMHTADQDWINSSFGTAVDNQLNTLWSEMGGSGILIGNGAPGTMADPNGGAGGLL